MSVLPLKSWIIYTRKAILWLGLGWPVMGFLFAIFSPVHASVTWTLIGASFMGVIFLPIVLVAAVVLPTYQLRIFGVPLFLGLTFWWVDSMSAYYKGFNLPLGVTLWIATFSAFALLMPQFSSAVAFIEKLVRRN